MVNGTLAVDCRYDNNILRCQGIITYPEDIHWYLFGLGTKCCEDSDESQTAFNKRL